MSESSVRIENVEQPLSQAVQDKILALWEAEDALIEDKSERLKEVLLLAWSGDELVGVASTGVLQHEGVRQPLFVLRVLVSSACRQQGLSYQLYQATVERAEQRFDSGEDVRAIGIYVEVEADLVADLSEVRCTFSHTHSQQGRPVQFNLVGMSESGYPQYIYYFDNASLFDTGPVHVDRGGKLEDQPGLELRYCWNSLRPQEQQQIVGLWMSFGVIKDRETCLQRLPQVCAIALEDGQVVGISSVFRSAHEDARANFLGFRSFVSPEARSGFIATKLLNLVYEEFNQRYGDEDALKDIHGVAYLLQNDGLNKNVRMARGPDVGSCLVGYINDLQFRAKYFDRAAVPLQP